MFFACRADVLSAHIVLWTCILTDFHTNRYMKTSKVLTKFEANIFAFVIGRMIATNIPQLDRRMCLTRFRIWCSSKWYVLHVVSETSFWMLQTFEQTKHIPVVVIKTTVKILFFEKQLVILRFLNRVKQKCN